MPLRGKIILAGLVVAAIWLAAGCALAQDSGGQPGVSSWPEPPPYRAWEFGKQPGPGYRGPGFYLSIPKLLLSWAMFLLWVRTTNWIAQDCLRVDLNYAVWNPVVFGVFVGAFLLLWLLPFIVGFPLLVIAYLAPLSAYLIVRNRKVQSHQRVMTPAHLRFVFANFLGMFGVKVAAEKVPEHQKGAPVNFKGTTGGGRTAETNLTLAHRSPGYVPAKGLVADLVDRGGDAIMLEFTQQNVAVKYQIDGVWHNVDPLQREAGDTILAVLKTMGGLDPAERVKRQDGTLSAEYKDTKYNCRFQSQGVESGERALLQLTTQKKQVSTLDELGMRTKTQDQLKELLNRPQGMIVFSSMPAGGLTSLYNGAVKACDRYMRDFAALTDANSGEQEVENVHVTTYNPAGGETPLPALQKIVRTYPNVILMRNLADGETANFLCEQTGEERLVLTSLRAKDASESLLRVLMLKVPQKDFANAVIGAASVRLVRKLCNECKEAYPPPAEILQQLGIPAGKVQTLFRPPSQPDPKKPCPACGGIGYKGRTGMFELLIVDDAVREVLVKSPKVDLVRSTARRAGMKTFQEEGLVLVVKGTTSLVELQRVLKG